MFPSIVAKLENFDPLTAFLLVSIAIIEDENDYLNDSFDFDTFKSNIENGNNDANTPYYGEYTVQAAEYIVFTGGNEAPDGSGDNNILKITIGSGNQALTTLFRK